MSDNPTINRYLENKAFDLIDHALGRPLDPRGETYRNYFCVYVSDPLCGEFDDSPHWQRCGRMDDMRSYKVTPAGQDALADHLRAIRDTTRLYAVTFAGLTMNVPAKSHGAARYVGFLRVSDCDPDLTFGDFCQRSTVRRAA